MTIYYSISTNTIEVLCTLYRYTISILLNNAFTLYANLNYKNHILIRKQYTMINYEMTSRVIQVKHIMVFFISQGNTVIENNKSINMSMYYSILLYIYIRLHFLFLLHTVPFVPIP